MSFESIADKLCVFSIFSSGGHLVQWSRTKIPNFKEGSKRNISVKLL